MPATQYPAYGHSACPHDCPSTCALEVELLDAKTIGRVKGAAANSYTAGVICAKVARYAERVHHPDRLAQPLIRTGSGLDIDAFKPVSWDQALDQVAEQFISAMQTRGSETLWPYHYAGTMGLVQRDCIELFRNVTRSSRQHSTFCVTLADAGWKAGTGAKRGSDSREMANSELIVVWGGNPVYTQVNVMQHIARAKRQQQARLVVIDPYYTATAKKADMHLMLKPGSDGALACAVMHQLFADELVDRDYLHRYCDVPDQMEQHLLDKNPEWAAPITGLSADQIIQFARLYGSTGKSFLRLGYGFSRSLNGAVNMHAASCLPALTGAWKYRGGGALYSNGDIYGIDQTMIKGLDVVDEQTRILDQSRLGEILLGNPKDLQGGPPVSAMLVQNSNPVVTAPESKKVIAGLARKDLFVAVHEQFFTETAAMADVILPATMFLEHDDFYQASGHSHLQVTRQLIEPYAQCRSNHWLLQQLATRMGFSHPGFETDARGLIEQSLQATGLPDEKNMYQAHWHDMAGDFETSNFLNGFDTADRRFHFRADWDKVGSDIEGLPELPDYMPVANAADAEHPFRLVAAPARQFLNTSFSETRTSIKAEGRPTLLIKTEDAQALDISDSALVRIGNKLADLLIHVRYFDGVQSGVVIVESIWPNHSFVEGLGINALVSATAGKPNGGAIFHDTAIWIKPIKEDKDHA